MSPVKAEDLYDAEVVLERAGVNGYTTTNELGLLLGATTALSARQKVFNLRKAKRIPPPAEKGGSGVPNRWTRDQVLRIVAENPWLPRQNGNPNERHVAAIQRLRDIAEVPATPPGLKRAILDVATELVGIRATTSFMPKPSHNRPQEDR